MGRSVVVAVGKLLWAMRRRTVVVWMVTLGVSVFLVGGMALANVPPSDPGSGSAPPSQYEFAAVAFSMSLQHVPNRPNLVWDADTGQTLKEAKLGALGDCRDSGDSHPKYYKEDCQGGVWVRNGWVAFAVEDLPDPGDKVTRGYEQAYGLDYAQTQAKARSTALDNCSLDDPKYKRCQVEIALNSEYPFDLDAYKGGSW
jgi:hypothetical protein